MYFEGKLTVDPSEITKIEKVKPSKAFKRMFYYLTLGGITEKLERETFTAISILQQLNRVFSKQGINNIVRLSHDDIDFYLDKEGKKDDLKEALDLYDLKIDESMSIHFKQLSLVLEHDDEDFKYLIEVNINRDHSVGEYPIDIKISGLLKQFSSDKNEIKKSLGEIFESQEKYNKFKSFKETKFKYFLQDLKMSIKEVIKVDDVILDLKTKVIIPKQKVSSSKKIRHYRKNGYRGVYYGYYGFDDYIFYGYLWSEIASDYSLDYEDTYFETDTNQTFGHFDSLESDSSSFDNSIDIDTRTDNFGESESAFTSSDSSGGWFNSDSSWSSDSSSSCSSCSSCGGGCGGD